MRIWRNYSNNSCCTTIKQIVWVDQYQNFGTIRVTILLLGKNYSTNLSKNNGVIYSKDKKTNERIK